MTNHQDIVLVDNASSGALVIIPKPAVNGLFTEIGDILKVVTAHSKETTNKQDGVISVPGTIALGLQRQMDALRFEYDKHREDTNQRLAASLLQMNQIKEKWHRKEQQWGEERASLNRLISKLRDKANDHGHVLKHRVIKLEQQLDSLRIRKESNILSQHHNQRVAPSELLNDNSECQVDQEQVHRESKMERLLAEAAHCMDCEESLIAIAEAEWKRMADVVDAANQKMQKSQQERHPRDRAKTHCRVRITSKT